MNLKHRNIKITFETEDSNNFSFLNVKITQQNKPFLTSIFRKATISRVFTNYDSFISDNYKISLVHTLLFRFFKICSSMENFHIEVELLRSIFKCNNYPVNIIDQCIKKFFDRLCVPKQIVPTVPKGIVSCSSIFRNISFEFEKTLKMFCLSWVFFCLE